MKKLLRLFAYACIIALLWGAYSLFGGVVTDAFNSRAAEQAMEAGDHARAAWLYARVLDNSPRNEALRLKVSGLYREAGNLSRAEFILFSGLRDAGPSAALYRMLCALYTEQDKLFDAVALLDGINNPGIKSEIDALRPQPPVFSPPGGRYGERIGVELTAEEGCLIYVSWTGETPSSASGLYTDRVYLEPGMTGAQAVAVDADGLVSVWARHDYILENIVDPVVFADPALERVIRGAIGRHGVKLYTPDLWGITELWCDEETDYQTLDDLRYLPGLQKLGLTGMNGRSDLSALPSLTGLSVLSLRAFGVTSLDLEIIGRCVRLEELYLPDNRIGPVRLLEGLEQLTVLDLSSNSVLDVSPLGSLTRLEELILTRNAVQEISGLQPLSDLRVLLLDENQVTSLIGLDKLTGLKTLDLSFNPGLTAIGEVAELRALASLYAVRCQIGELPGLNRLTALEELYIGFNALPDLNGLDGLTALRILHCNDNDIVSLEPLAGSTGLVELNASQNRISSVEPLKGLPALKSLRIERNSLTTLLALRDCPALDEVYAAGNSISDPLGAFNGTRLEGKVSW
jgi:Leucine-rich repeat (LRR) protein